MISIRIVYMSSIIMIFIAFTVTVFVHELGHYIMAKRAGVKVLKFSIGIGPKLLTLYRDKSGTEWIISILPFGGFVQLKGQNDSPFDHTPDGKDDDDYRVKTPKKRLSIILAGVVMNALFAYILLITAYSLGVPFTSNTVGSITPNSIAEKKGFKKGDTIKKINGESVESWEDYSTILNLSTKNSLEFIVNRNNTEKTIVISSNDIPTIKENDIPLKEIGLFPQTRPIIETISKKIDRNIIEKSNIKKGQIITKAKLLSDPSSSYTSAYGISSIIKNNPNKQIELTLMTQSNEKSTVSLPIISKNYFDINSIQTQAIIEVLSDYPASDAGIKNKDKIIKINNRNMKGWKDVYTYLSQVTNGKPLKIVILRNQKKLIFNVSPLYSPNQERYLVGISPLKDFSSKVISYIPNKIQSLKNSPKVGDIILEMKQSPKDITMTLQRNSSKITSKINIDQFPQKKMGYLFDFSIEEKMVKYSFIQSIRHSFKRSYYEIINSISFITSLIKGDISPKLIGGPVKIFQISHFVAENKAISYFLMLFAKIGFSLAIINLLPIPILDGGHALLIIIEMIRRKPLSEKTTLILYQIGIYIMLLLTVFVFYNDISSLL